MSRLPQESASTFLRGLMLDALIEDPAWAARWVADGQITEAEATQLSLLAEAHRATPDAGKALDTLRATIRAAVSK